MKKVLIVDDKEENRYYLERLLEGHGFAVESARHGAEALAKARAAPPAAAVSDLLMPVMDGYTLLRHWKSDARLRTAPFLVYTATYTEPDDEKLAIDLGADAFILKPAEPEEFLARLHAVLDRGVAPATGALIGPGSDDAALLKTYSETLIRKLEEKTLQLEEANAALERDLRERKVVEAALRDSEAQFRTLADAVPQIVWITRPDGANIYLNRQWADYTGLPLAGGAGDGWLEPFDPADRPTIQRLWQRGNETSGPHSLECRIRRADGQYRWWLMRGGPLRDDAGQVIRWFGTCTDIHDLKEAQEQLRRAQRLEVIGQLTGGVAHDFNNILNVILANVEALAEDPSLPSTVSERIGRIDMSVQRATELIRQLLAFSRKQALRPQPTDINELVSSTGKLLRRSLGEHIEIDAVLADDLWVTSIDRAQLEAALVNLCVNARDAMPGGGRLLIETHNATLDDAYVARHPDAVAGDHVQLVVRDSGIGIPPAVLDKVFEPFFTTKEEGKGTGLGLSMVYGFIRQSNGHVRIESEEGNGTSVMLYFPRGEGTPDGDAAAPSPTRPAARERILLVEDDHQVRSSIMMQLASLGYEAVEAAGGAAAIVACEQAPLPFDLVLTDVIMPGAINGRALGEEIARRWPRTRIVYMSGYPEDAMDRDGRLDPGVLLLAKPFRKADLARMLRDAIDQPAVA